MCVSLVCDTMSMDVDRSNWDDSRVRRRRSRVMPTEGKKPAYGCVDFWVTSVATVVGVGMSSMVDARGGVGVLRREYIGPVRGGGSDANGGDSAVSVPWGPI